MAQYEFSAVATDGRQVQGREWAENELALDRELESRGWTLCSAKPVHRRPIDRRARLKRRELVNFSHQLATVVAAGVPLVEGLEGIGARMGRRDAVAVVGLLVEQLKEGASLSEAMGRQPRSFPGAYRAGIGAGEAAGGLDVVLPRLAKHLEWQESMRATTLQALIYPAILCAALCGLIAVLLYFVLPRILSLFPGGAAALPLETRVVMALSAFARANALWIAAGTGLLVCALSAALRNARGRLALSTWLLTWPKLGPLARRLATARFASTASTLQASGCDVYSVITIAGSSSGNAALEAGMLRVAERIRAGSNLSQALSREPGTDPLLLQMVAVGENSGSLDGCLSKLVEYYDQEIPREVKRFLSFFEPALLVGAGAIVAFVLLAALLPIFDLYEKLG